MKKKIFLNMCLVVLFAILLTTILSVMIVFDDTRTSMQNQTRAESNYLSVAYDTIGADYFDDLSVAASGRITHIAVDGTVLFDSKANVAEMENHLDRAEVLAALADGSGSATRLSSTLNQETYYYAVTLRDGTILRVANSMNTVYVGLLSMLPWAIGIIILALAVSAIVAHYQTKAIVKPINFIDLDDPESNVIYEELTPLLSRMEKQQRQIKHQMLELETKQTEFAAITGNMQEGLIILDDKSDILSINTAALEILGAEKTYKKNSNIFTINRSQVFSEIVEAVLGGNSVQKIIKLNDRYLEFMANPVIAENKVSGGVLVCLDVTERERREELRREFTANVSHELKTPLTSISGYAEIIMNGLVKPQDVKGFAANIYNEAQRLINLVLDIIKLSRLDETDESINRERVNIMELAESIKSRLQPQLKEKSVDLIIDGENINVYGIRHMLDEMLFNLCDNGLKYNRPGGTLMISLSKNADKKQIKIIDNGIGIPSQDLNRVFERFYRVDKSHSKETGGTGLGLSIVKHCVLIHKGSIELDSKVGEGTTVTITLP